MSTQEKIQEVIDRNPVVIFMKGSPEAPQCGFSAQAVQCLKESGVNALAYIDVLSDPEVRQGIKDLTQWPTIPQIFIKGEFIGGCDIVTEMHQRGELKTKIEEATQ